MRIRDFTSEDYPVLIAIQNSQGIVWPEQPRTPEVWFEADRIRVQKPNSCAGSLHRKNY